MTDLRRLQLVQLEILSTFDSLCRKLGLRYSLAYGTLLGAVRHKGFIPWDDDIDVCMLRHDYDLLIEHAAELLPSNYFLQSVYSDPKYPLDFAKLLLTDESLSVTETKKLEITHGIFMDIFPIDACSNSRLVDWFDRLDISIARVLCFSTIDEQFESSFIREQVKRVASKVTKRWGTQAFVEHIDNIRRKRNSIHNTQSYYYYSGDSPLKYDWDCRLPISLMNDLIELEFEGRLFPCIKQYDDFLTCVYGDYMKLPPMDLRKPSHVLEEVTS